MTGGQEYFHEEQSFRGSWLWVATIVPAGIVTLAAGLTSKATALAIALPVAIIILVALLFVIVHLETRVTADELVVAFHGLWPTRRIRLDDIAGYEAKRYAIWDSGGWGVHLGLAGMTYNVRGNDGSRYG